MSSLAYRLSLIALLLVGHAAGTRVSAQDTGSANGDVILTEPANDDSVAAKTDEANVPLAGHSEHGAAYNEGPRQNAYLMGGTGKVNLSVTTSSPQAQAFFNQGLGQLYGFWYYEAERSFRRVVALDPDCAMGYWGLAQANIENQERGESFIEQAHAKREQAGKQEQLYIDALSTYLSEEGKEEARRKAYVKDLEEIIREYPDGLEAKAMLAVHLWQSSHHGLPIISHQAVDSMLEDIFRVEPLHPAHHFRIHLWDHEAPEQALGSAAICGQVAPTIAHMWHMPGHIYSRLHRFHDAIFQQEASARADHAHMMRDGVLPDQIHNYAHNNEWLIRCLVHVGRAGDALDLAKNMLELPHHPKYNSYALKGMCSCKYGRRRLLQIYETFEMWDELVQISHTMYLPPTDERAFQTPRLRLLGIAHYRRGASEELADCIRELEKLATAIGKDCEKAAVTAEQEVREEASKPQQPAEDGSAKATKNVANDSNGELGRGEDEHESDSGPAESDVDGDKDTANKQPDSRQLAQRIKKARKAAIDRAGKGKDAVGKAIAELTGLQCLARGETELAKEQFDNSDCPKPRLAEYCFLCGDHEKSRKLLDEAVDAGQNQVRPLAKKADLLRRMGHADAEVAFAKLRSVAGTADLDSPLLKRLSKFAQELEYPTDWRLPPEPQADVGERPDLDTLGPLRWAPSPAKSWTLLGASGAETSLDEYRGRPLVIIFYLGSGCLHCVEQLHKFAPLREEFESAGISLVAISTESEQELQTSLDNYNLEGNFPIRLVSDKPLSVFKAYRAYDDFEEMPLHGTFLIDAQGLIRWHDISYEPFLDAAFLIRESRRLLSQDG